MEDESDHSLVVVMWTGSITPPNMFWKSFTFFRRLIMLIISLPCFIILKWTKLKFKSFPCLSNSLSTFRKIYSALNQYTIGHTWYALKKLYYTETDRYIHFILWEKKCYNHFSISTLQEWRNDKMLLYNVHQINNTKLQ